MSFPFRRAPKEFKRKITERKTEAKRAKKENITSADYQNIRNKLGLSKNHKEWKIRAELLRLSRKRPKTWLALGLTREDFKAFDIDNETIHRYKA